MKFRFTGRHLIYLNFAAGMIALAVFATIWILDYLDKQNDGYSAKQLYSIMQTLNEKSPETDASKRFQSGDTKFSGCWGEPGGPFFPGIPHGDWEQIRSTKNYWTLDGTTDALESNHHLELIDRAWAYAERYNIEILRLLRQKKSKKVTVK